MTTRQQLEQQLVAAHRSGNVQAAQQAAYAIRQYDQNALYAQVPSVNAPPPIERVPKPTFGDWLENVSYGWGKEYANQIQGLTDSVQRGVSAFAKDPLKASAAAFMSALEPARQGFTQPVQTAKDVGTGLVETGKQMYQQATSGPVGLGQTLGQLIDMPGPDLPGGKRRPTMAELDVYHGTPHTFEPEEGAPLGRFRSSKIGTGEGAQAYGYGLYLAQSPDIAGGYAYNLGYRAGNLPTINGKPITDLYRRIEDKAATMSPEASRVEYQKLDFLEQLMQEQGTPAKVLAGLKGQEGVYPQAVDWFKKEVAPKYKGPGTTYKVDLPDSKIEQMLDWDKPFAQQSDHVKRILKESGLYKEYRANLSDFSSPMNTRNKNMRGENFLSFVENKFQSEARNKIRNGENVGDTSKYGAVKAAEYLRSLGIPGIKYLDAGSRAEGKKTRNFVVFPGEEQHLTILERDGVKAEVPKPAAPVIDTTKSKREQLRQLHQQSGVSFVDSTIDRGGAHTPAGPTSGSPAYDVALNGTYPEDFYGANGLRYYGTGYDAMDRQAYDKIRRMEGRPNAPVEVYRAVEKGGPKTISPGDWVTTVRDYAKDHGESALNGDYKIIKALVNARDIYTAGDSMLEWGYHPQPRMPQLPKVDK